MEAWLPSIVIGIIFSVIGYLLADKDRKQGAETEKMFMLHHRLKEEISLFQLKVAENHYPKNELDRRFDHLNHTITVGFSKISGEVHEMNKAIQEHNG
jgi:hypothetical protein